MDINWTEVLGLLKENPILLLIAIIILIITSAIVFYKPKNKIGKIKSKRAKVIQEGVKTNEIKEIDSEELELSQR
ncbi:hypothetical protein [Aliarcobacter butzleri]|uniref:hypothetical protein n=1 Tax=Aliarcobacter butzleri TaxID=28197 RepID=UPI0012604559|nr:hypothetical protein [Aliarcobacter butzleri]